MDAILRFFRRLADFFRKLFGKDNEPYIPGIGDAVAYYGCPNSKRVEKLNTSKKEYNG